MATNKNSNAKNTKNEKKNRAEFDSSRKYTFKADVIPGPGLRNQIEVSAKVETYDDLLDALDPVIQEKFPDEYFPKLDLDYDSIRIVEDGTEYPVLPESRVDEKIGDFRGIVKCLVLPECTYSIAPEFKLYQTLCEKGLIDAKSTPYDYGKMSEILTEVEKTRHREADDGH